MGFPRRDDGRRNGAVTMNGEMYRRRDLRPASLPAFTLTEKVRSWRRWPLGLLGETTGTDTAASPRRITLPEASVLQGFPPDYPWSGERSVQFHQVADAVPPPMAHAVLSAAMGIS